MSELKEFNFALLWTELQIIQAPALEKLQTIDRLLSSCLININFDYYTVKQIQQKKTDK